MTLRGTTLAAAVASGVWDWRHAEIWARAAADSGPGAAAGDRPPIGPDRTKIRRVPDYSPVSPGTDKLTPVTDQEIGGRRKTLLGDLFSNRDDPNTTVEVNKYLWNAALDVLNFLPIESADPFSGVIVTGYGTPPGGGRAYRATIYVQDPALDARSLKLSLQTAAAARPARTPCARSRTRS